MQLRPYQTEIVDKVRGLMHRGCRSILLQTPTGGGKTAMIAHMIATAAAKGKTSMFIVHRRELLTQASATFSANGIRHGFIAAGFPSDPHARVQIASVDTLRARLASCRQPDLVAFDECHHVAAGTWMSVFENFRTSYHIGLTATPERLDGRGLRPPFEEMVLGPPVGWLIENGYLSDYVMYAPSSPDLSGVGTLAADFNQKAAAEAMRRGHITGDAIKHYQDRAYGKRAAVFCVTIEHSMDTVRQFKDAGIPAAHIDGKMSTHHRDAVIEAFRQGRIKVLSNVALVGEGFDLPAMEAVILLRPTQSLGLYLQQVGRALRPHEGKDRAIILDHAGNALRHGLPDDDREWSLDAAPRKSRKKTAETQKACAVCFSVMSIQARACPECGYSPSGEKREIEVRDGTLVEVDRAKAKEQRRRRQEERDARTLDDLIEVGRRRGYRSPEAWAAKIISVRMMYQQKYGGRAVG